jgi:hypothetical protein
MNYEYETTTHHPSFLLPTIMPQIRGRRNFSSAFEGSISVLTAILLPLANFHEL